MEKWIALIGLGTSMLAVLAVEANAAEASYRPAGKVHGLKVQAGKDTSASFARVVARTILRNSCEGTPHRLRSPRNGRNYRLRCLTIVRRGYSASNVRQGWTIPVWGGRGERLTDNRVSCGCRGRQLNVPHAVTFGRCAA